MHLIEHFHHLLKVWYFGHRNGDVVRSIALLWLVYCGSTLSHCVDSTVPSIEMFAAWSCWLQFHRHLFLSWDLIHDKSTLVEVIVWCRQAASHYLYQWWAVSMTPCGTTGSQCNLTKIPWHVFDAVPQNTSGSLRNLWKLNPGWSFLFLFTMTSSNGNIFRVNFWCFLWSTPK